MDQYEINGCDLPPKPNGNGIGSGAIDSDTSRSLDLSESGGLFRAGFSSSMISSMGGCIDLNLKRLYHFLECTFGHSLRTYVWRSHWMLRSHKFH